MRLLLENRDRSPLDVIVEQTGVGRVIAPGDQLAVEWTWLGFADVTFAVGRLSLSVRAGGSITIEDAVYADRDLYNMVATPERVGIHEFWIHNSTDAMLDTFWEPWCGEGSIPAGGGPMRVQWTDNSRGAEIIYEPGLVTLWDRSSFRAWQPDGEEVFTGGEACTDPEDLHPPRAVPGWPR